MIKSENGTVKMEGTRIELRADIIVIMKGLMEKNILDKDDLEMSLAMACMDNKDIKNAARGIREAIALASLIFGDKKDE